MSNVVMANVVRFISLVLLQVIIFQRIPNMLGSFNQFEIFIYPIFIILLPLRVPHTIVILLGFLIGISVDCFYDSPGVHASAGVFTGFIRPAVTSILQPRGGYNTMLDIPTKDKFGISWFMPYMLILLFAHIFFYFSVEAFTFVYIDKILLNSIVSFMVSGIFITLFQYIFNPKV